MHELSLSTGIVEVVLRHAAGRRVTSVDVRCGALRQVVPASLEFYFGIVARDTLADGAQLEVTFVPALLRCRACEHAWSPEVPWFRCPECASEDVVIEAGEELEIESIMVEEPACTA